MVTIAGIVSTSTSDWLQGLKSGEYCGCFRLSAFFQCSYGSLGNVAFNFNSGGMPWELVGNRISTTVSGWNGYLFGFPTQFSSETQFQNFINAFLSGTPNATINAINNNADLFVSNYSSRFHMPALNYSHDISEPIPIEDAFYSAVINPASNTVQFSMSKIIPSKYLYLTFYYYDYNAGQFVVFADGQNKPASTGETKNKITCAYTMPEGQARSIFACVATIGAEIIDDASAGTSHMAYTDLWSASAYKSHYATVTVTYGEHGTVTPSGDITVLVGSPHPLLKMQAESGYVIDSITVNGIEINNDASIISNTGVPRYGISNYLETRLGIYQADPYNIVYENSTVHVTFKAQTNPTVSFVVEPKGKNLGLTHGGYCYNDTFGFSVETGSSFDFGIAKDAEPEYHLEDVSINGVSYGAIEGGTVENIQSDVIIRAIFATEPTEPETPAPLYNSDWNLKGIYPLNHPSAFMGYKGVRNK